MQQLTFPALIPLTQNLIRAQSYSGQEQHAAAALKDYFSSAGYDEVFTDDYGSVTGIINGAKPGPTILFDGHIDTVKVGNLGDWTQPPFEGKVVGERLYGRGASDMKGAVAAMACAAAQFAARTGKDFAGRLAVAGVVQEECFEGVAARLVSERVRPDLVVIGEASEGNLKIGQRGRAEIRLEVFGKPAHSANPEMGINAVYKICALIEAVRGLAPTSHPVLGKGILELTDIKSSPYPGMSVVPEYCAATYDRRLLPGETLEGVLAPLQALVETQMAADPQLTAKVGYAVGREPCYTGSTIESERFFPAWLFSQQDEFVAKIKAKMDAYGLAPAVEHYNFCTNGSHYAGEAGIPTVGFGPSRENLAHTIDEYVELEQLQRAAVGYTAIIEAIL